LVLPALVLVAPGIPLAHDVRAHVDVLLERPPVSVHPEALLVVVILPRLVVVALLLPIGDLLLLFVVGAVGGGVDVVDDGALDFSVQNAVDDALVGVAAGLEQVASLGLHVVHPPQASVEPQESLLLHLSPLRLFGLLGGCATTTTKRTVQPLQQESIAHRKRRHTLVEFAFLCRLGRLALMDLPIGGCRGGGSILQVHGNGSRAASSSGRLRRRNGGRSGGGGCDSAGGARGSGNGIG
jgi:hypothetical protein